MPLEDQPGSAAGGGVEVALPVSVEDDMPVLGYEVGPVACEAAFVADFDVATTIPMSVLVDRIDEDRRTMAARPGMRNKYLPLRFDPATGARQIGGRYLFETWSDVQDYMRFTQDLEFEPGVKFWDRPFFSRIDTLAWHVVGAQEFEPLETHYASRFERFTLDAPLSAGALDATWRSIRDGAQAQGLAGAWLLTRPDIRQIGLLTAVTRTPSGDDAGSASLTLAALEARPSLGTHLRGLASPRPVFDRTSLNLQLWLPLSNRLGGDAVASPTFPVHPAPGRSA